MEVHIQKKKCACFFFFGGGGWFRVVGLRTLGCIGFGVKGAQPRIAQPQTEDNTAQKVPSIAKVHTLRVPGLVRSRVWGRQP